MRSAAGDKKQINICDAKSRCSLQMRITTFRAERNAIEQRQRHTPCEKVFEMLAAEGK
jgi:hypothetical protein